MKDPKTVILACMAEYEEESSPVGVDFSDLRMMTRFAAVNSSRLLTCATILRAALDVMPDNCMQEIAEALLGAEEQTQQAVMMLKSIHETEEELLHEATKEEKASMN